MNSLLDEFNWFGLIVGVAIILFAAPEIDAYVKGKGLKLWSPWWSRFIGYFRIWTRRTYYNSKPKPYDRWFLITVIIAKILTGLAVIVLFNQIK